MARRYPPIVVAAPLVLAVAGCNETSGPGTAFDETKGIWSVIAYDLDGNGSEPIVDSRKDGFLLRFVAEKKGAGVVSAAFCQDSSGNHWVNNSTCHIDPGAVWNCRCFKYEFEDTEMRWLEFPTDGTPPADVPDVSPGDADPMGVVFVTVEPDPDVATDVRFQPLPEGLFGSREDVPSIFVFRQRSESVWTEDDTTEPPDGPASVCDVCFP